MENVILNYLLQANLYLLLFYGLYWLLLRQETFFKWNRFYLLSSVIVALLIPIIPFPEILTEASTIQAIRQYNPSNLIIVESLPSEKATPISQVSTVVWSWQQYILLSCVIVSGLFFLRFLLNLYAVLRLTWQSEKEQLDGYYLIKVSKELPSFSFFNYLFLSEKPTLTKEDRYKIIQHEIAHARQWHSIDILLLELLTVFFWFNPVTYWYKKSMRSLHEYLVDAALVKEGVDKENYIKLLVGQFLDTEKNKLVSHISDK